MRASNICNRARSERFPHDGRAIVNNNVKLLRELLAEKPDRLEQRERYGRTPLMLAVTTERRSLACINVLLEAGVDVNARNPGGYTALHLVIWNEYFPPESASSEQIINVLLDAGALLEDDQNDRAWTPLLAAVCEDCCGDAQVLLERGADSNKLVKSRRLTWRRHAQILPRW